MKRTFLIACLALVASASAPSKASACGLLDRLREAREARRETTRGFLGCSAGSGSCSPPAGCSSAVMQVGQAPEAIAPAGGFLRVEKKAEAAPAPAPAIISAPACEGGACNQAPARRRFSLFR